MVRGAGNTPWEAPQGDQRVGAALDVPAADVFVVIVNGPRL